MSAQKLNRREFIRLGAVGLAAAGTLLDFQRLDAASRRPNFIIFYTDDQGIGDLDTYFESDIPTPNITALARSGATFTNWYSSSPVCSPSRASLLTGRYPQRTGVSRILRADRNSPGLFEDEVTIAGALRDNGYRTGIFGKWHLGSSPESRPNRQGFDEFYGFLSGCIDYYSHIMYWEQGPGRPPLHDLWHNETEVWENGTYFTDIITRESKRFIRENRERPFFMYVAYSAPHYPLHYPARYDERFAHLDKHRRMQAAMVATVDDSMGEIMGLLDELGLRDDTVIFFQSDNGATIEQRSLLDGSGEFFHGGSNGPYRGWKGGLFEGGIRMPALLSRPGHIPAGVVRDQVGCTTDILPTFLDIAGVSLPADRIIDGKDILPTAVSGAPSPHETLFWKIGDQVAARRERWKVILQGRESFETDPELPEIFLADLETDPQETRNLASEQPQILAEMIALARRIEQNVESRR